VDALKLHNSSYLNNFQELQERIKMSADEAEENLKFLKTLEDPCRKIEKALPAEIPKLLPDTLSAVRVIWELSTTYSSEDKMKGLLTKISNQIIRRCRSKINKDDMLGNDVEKCMRDLDESIDCCQQWKEICIKAQRRIIRNSSKPNWNIEGMSAIFAENEAFIQRCRDLKEICEGQLQFALRGASCQMPIFGGSRAKEWTDSLDDLKRDFLQHLETIKNLNYDILDVKITRWHDDYGSSFKEQVKNLETIYTTIIAKTFQHVSTMEDAVEMLENFYQLAKRQSIKDYVQQKAAELVYAMFIKEISEVEEIFEGIHHKKKPPMPISHPEFGGIAIWTYSLINRVERAKNAIDAIFFVKEHPKKTEAEAKYKKLKEHQLEQFIIGVKFKDWTTSTEDLQKESDITIALE
jgi:dynein heavy chain, axonemal